MVIYAQKGEKFDFLLDLWSNISENSTCMLIFSIQTLCMCACVCRVTQVWGSVLLEGPITLTSEKTPLSSSPRLYLEGPQPRMDDSGTHTHK